MTRETPGTTSENAGDRSAVPHLSLVIPAYNEAKRIGDALCHVVEYLYQQDYSFEIVVVDDGSEDDTADLVEQRFPKVRLISYAPNRGKGHAVKAGMTAATGAYRVFYDADASTPMQELEKLWPRFEDGADIVIGSRTMPGSRVEVPQAWYRKQMGRVFNLVLRCFGLTKFPDTQCGFKGFSARACDIVFPRQTIDHFSFDAELLFIAQRHGLRIDQVPVRWINSTDTRVSAMSDSFRMFRDAFGIRVKGLRGVYR
jgi:dolichyl-phosphate beta-glucosyltransferase